MDHKQAAQQEGAGEEGPKRFPPITVDVMRGSLVESRHVVYGAFLRVGSSSPQLALSGREGIGWGDGALPVVLRSALKPWQLLPLLVDGGADAFALSDQELALAAASHAAQPEHLRVLDGLMEKTGVREEVLRCPGHAPFDEESAREVGAGWTKRHDNCSGKHAAMVAWCRHMGHDPTGYTSRDHPLQTRILELLKPLAGGDVSTFGAGSDGCRVPTVGLGLASVARLFLLLGDPALFRECPEYASLNEAEAMRVIKGLNRIAGAMAAHPLMVAGRGRPDTVVGETTKGRVVTKVGAEGIWAGVDREKKVAFAFKSIDGGGRAVVPAALSALEKLEVFSQEEMGLLEPHARRVVRDRGGDISGRIIVHLPEGASGASGR